MKKAVLFITFNRLDYVKETFEQIKIAKPPRFYIASDGPREQVEGEKEVVQSVRDYILNNIDWDCEVKTRFLDKNSGGCAYGVSGAVTWFFENEKDGIILEDDCVPSQSFFKFCEVLLDKYKDNKKVWHITGDAACPNLNIKESYYFAKIQHCWGWASWADRWKYHKLDLADYDRNNIKKLSPRPEVQKYWEHILDMMIEKPGFTWDYQYTLIIAAHNGYCINPTKNLIRNIGVTGEHYSADSPNLGKPTFELDKIVHPKFIKYNWKAIDYIYKDRFGIKSEYKAWYKKIFSVQNEEEHKIWTILGIKIKIRRKKKGKVINIPIFLASDNNYVSFLCTTMYSILNNTKSFVEFHILDGGIEEENKNLIKQSLKKFNNYSTKYFDMSVFRLDRFPNLKHYSLNTFSRYFIPILVPEIDKLIYIDVDVIVNGDISELYNIDLNDKALAAVPENFYKLNGEYVKEHIKPDFENTENYFNAGVMLLNIPQFIKNDYSKILIDKTIEFADKLSCPDQDIFNIVFERNHKLIDYKYNYMPDFYEAYKKVTDNVDVLDNNAVIYHYTCGKPWKNNGQETRKSDLFWNTLKKTAFYNKIRKKYNNTEVSQQFYNNPYERIVSFKNKDVHKIITVLGIKIKLKRKNNEQKS